ncbi:DsbA family oxidoreductase [Dysgonomonas sp. OttesenSCG-928-M03]|nr:DsbA family oxidoreductase [Dysgonomonas sp. OttesenSCG-928-M03]
MKIEIWSDIACPYCYIGKHRMEEALNQFPHANEVELIWHSYELNPSLAKAPLGKSIYKYMAEQYNNTEESQKKGMESITAIGKSLGLEYNFDKLVVTNTSDALRLVKLAKKYNLADQAEEVLFKAYFTDGECISDKDTLIKLGKNIGIPETEIVKMLDSNEYLDEITNDIRYSEDKLDLQYIPFYLFNNKDIIQGSLTTEEYLEMLDKSYNYWKQNGVSLESGDRISGKACSIDGTCSL